MLEGLKMVMNSKEYEERLPALKDAILGIQARVFNQLFILFYLFLFGIGLCKSVGVFTL